MKISENDTAKELKKENSQSRLYADFGSVLSWQGQKESNSQHTVLETCTKSSKSSTVAAFCEISLP